MIHVPNIVVLCVRVCVHKETLGIWPLAYI